MKMDHIHVGDYVKAHYEEFDRDVYGLVKRKQGTGCVIVAIDNYDGQESYWLWRIIKDGIETAFLDDDIEEVIKR